MSKKETYISLFKSCCSAEEEQKELVFQQKVRRQKKEPKISLKQTLHRTNSSNFTRFENNSLHKPLRDKLQHYYQSTKQNNHLSPNHSGVSPYHTCIPKNLPLKQRQSKQIPKHAVRKSKGFISLNQGGSGHLYESQLEKTAKLNSSKLKPTQNMGHLYEADLQQTKQISKNNFLSNLSSFKLSVVSISNDNDTVNEKFEQSMIMIDYFNPNSSKEIQIQSYLQSRE